jgi:nucleoside-diphosphate-sugar epimerase
LSGNKNILITGASGAVGFELVSQLCRTKTDHQISVIVRDSKRNKKKLSPFENEIKIFYGDLLRKETLNKATANQDIIIHLAAIIPPQFEKNIGLGKRTIIEGTSNLIESVTGNSPKAFFIYSSSVATYGDRLKNYQIKVGDELNEDQEDEYGKAKIKAEKIIQDSKLDWSIFRLTAIMGIGNHKMSGIMFDMPLETRMEFCTVRDTARAFANSIHKTENLKEKIFNLSGGEFCRITYEEFLTKAFKSYGMGDVNFPEYAFARQNFHCGYFEDGDDLEEILHFRSDTIDSYFQRFRKSVPSIQRIFTVPFAGIVKFFLVKYSEPYKAYKTSDKEKISHYFGVEKLDEWANILTY